MKRILTITVVSFVLLLFSCEEGNIIKEPETLGEIIFGTWEHREDLSFFHYRDLDFHPLPFDPLPVIEFIEPDSFAITELKGVSEQGTFELNEKDSILYLNGSRWDIFGYSKDTLDIRSSGREGPYGNKYFKLE